jgi:tRNA pseudouridine38-40 synthase
MERQYFFTVAYRGTNYHGWQRQPNAITVQEKIEEAFSLVLQKKIEISGSGRTDTGVHAISQVFQLAIENTSNVEKLLSRVNKILPFDIAINDFKAVKEEAHSRFDAISRSYQYKIGAKKNPFGEDLVYHFHAALDFQKMNVAAAGMKEYTDFESFSKVKTGVNTFNCKIFEAQWKPASEQVNEEWVFHVTANRFLRGMVRAIVGTLLDVGIGRISLSDFDDVIKAKNRTAAGRAVPAHGLYLTDVKYPESTYL